MSIGHSGSAPSPFDAINGPRLAGDSNEHPLHDVQPEELLNPGGGDALRGHITVDGPAMVGEPIRGSIELSSPNGIKARSAHLRLVGLRLMEERHSSTNRTGTVTTTQTWVQADGNLFSTSAFQEPPIPSSIEPGQTFTATFAIPAPALGPPTAHLGEAIVAWALEVRFDVPHAYDSFVATYLPIAQHPNLLAAGVGVQGGESMLASVDVGGATISLHSALPARPGSRLDITIAWPAAPSGTGRVELHRRSNAPNGDSAVVASTEIDAAELAAGANVWLPLRDDLSPSFDGAGLQLLYVLRVLVDRRFMPDAAIERPVAIS
jgi:hypothetical protein